MIRRRAGLRQVGREPDLEHQDREQEPVTLFLGAGGVAANEVLDSPAVEELDVPCARVEEVVAERTVEMTIQPGVRSLAEEADLPLVDESRRG